MALWHCGGGHLLLRSSNIPTADWAQDYDNDTKNMVSPDHALPEDIYVFNSFFSNQIMLNYRRVCQANNQSVFQLQEISPMQTSEYISLLTVG